MAVPLNDVPSISVNRVAHSVRVAEFRSSDHETAITPAVAFGTETVLTASHPLLRLRPSDAERDDEASLAGEFDIGGRLQLNGATDMTIVGEALHRFLAADDPSRDEAWRVALASRLLNAWGVTSLDPRHVIEMGTRFRAFVDKCWPQAVLRREAPIAYRLGDQTMSGRLDLVVEATDEIVIIDHKSFPGGHAQWLEQARKYAGQLRLYRDAVRAAVSDAKTVRMALHLPIGGKVFMVE